MIDFIDWRITSACNNVCYYCYASEKREKISFKQQILIADKIISNCKAVCITGGEPLLDAFDTIELIKYLYFNGVEIHLSTNGTNLLENIYDVLPYVKRISLPLDGFDMYTNAFNGRKKESFASVYDILKFFQEPSDLGLPFIKINTTLTELNCDVEILLKIYQLLNSFNVDLWEIYEFIPEKVSNQNLKRLSLDHNKYIDVKDVFQEKIKGVKSNSKLRVEFSSRYGRDSVYCIIRPDGTVFIPIDENDAVIEKDVGNLLYDDFCLIEKKWRDYAKGHDTFMSKRIKQKKDVQL